MDSYWMDNTWDLGALYNPNWVVRVLEEFRFHVFFLAFDDVQKG